MIESATAVAILQMYQMYSGGHLVQPSALSRANSTFRPGWPGLFFSTGTDSWLLWASCSSALLSPKWNRKIAKAKIISCLQRLLFCWFCACFFFFFKPASLSIFVWFLIWRMSDPLFCLILIHIFKNWKAVESKKKCIGSKFQFLSFKYFLSAQRIEQNWRRSPAVSDIILWDLKIWE